MSRYTLPDVQKKDQHSSLFSPFVFGVALVFALIMLCLTFFWILWSAPAGPDPANMLAAVTILPTNSPTAGPTASPTFDPYASTPTPTLKPGQFALGAMVQISGTQGEGLRIRSQPGLNSPQLFLGFDTEAYSISDGPREVDGYTWYYLVAINDQKRSGWAVSNFLTLIQNP